MKKILLIVGFAFVLSIGSFAQTTHMVTNINDSGPGSLRDAIADVSTIDGDIIRFDESLINSGNATITLTSEIAFSKALTFKGLYNSTDTLKISGGNGNRIFNITNAGKTVIDSLMLIDGSTGPSISGGAISIYNCTDTLWILNSIISGNAAGESGGGIYASSDVSVTAVVINDSKIIGNSAPYRDGGGVHSSSFSFPSYLAVHNSTIDNNTGSSGGGLSSSSPSSIITVNNSTISNNRAYNGGAVSSFSLVTSGPESTFSSITINNSTITDNSATNGGGIYSGSFSTSSTPGSTSSSNVSVNNSTIFNNYAIVEGGGVHSSANSDFSSESSSVDIVSSIVGYNENNSIVNSSGIYNNMTPVINSAGYNIFSDLQTDAIGTDQVNVNELDLNLQPLTFNGGSTKTMKPGIGSVAINTGDPVNTDAAQNGNINGVRDCGAAEACISISSFSLISCADYTVPSGDETYTTSGMYMDTIQNAAGCDSIMTISVTITINQPTIGDTTAVACGSFTWYGTEYTTTGSPTHVLMNAAGCDSTITLNLTINPLPDNTVTLSNDNSLEANQTGATYQWINCSDDSEIAGATDQTYVSTADGDYAVVVTMNGCSDTSECEATLGVNENDIFANVALYPNPSNDVFTIETSVENASVSVYSVEGKVILANSILTNSQKTFNVKGIEAGVYFVKISNELSQKTMRLIIE